MAHQKWYAGYSVSDGPHSGTKTFMKLDASSEEDAHQWAQRLSREYGEAAVMVSDDGMFADTVAYYVGGDPAN